MADNPTEALENTVLVLYAPQLPGATKVVGADLGVSLEIYDEAPMGAKVIVDPYLGQREGDTVTLYLNSQPAGIDSEQTASDSSATTLYIPKKLLLADIINYLTYSVTRNSQNTGTSVPPLELLYNAFRPGNRDTDDGEDGHSRLDLLLPDAIKHGVGPDFPPAGAQVCVSYPYCRAYDRILLNCNGHEVIHTVTSLQAPKPGSDEPVTVCFPLTRADLEKAKDHPQFKFSYTVIDQLTNRPDPKSPRSATQIVDVDLTGSRLPMPILREILDDRWDEPRTIDLEKLGKNPLWLIVLTNDPRFKPGDTLNATYTATVTGQPDVVVAVSGIVETDEVGQKKSCFLKVANDQVIAGSMVTATYQLLRNGAPQGNSRVASARVIGEGLPDLKPPRLQKSVNGVLDPLNPANLQGANGQVEVLDYRKGDTVQLIVEGAPGAGSPTFTPRPLNANSRANFPLTKAFIAANMGKQVKLSYLLIRNGKPPPPQSSPVLTASVGTIPDGHPSLPTPAIDRAPGTELDVTQLQATDKLRVGEWTHQVVGQNVWLRYDGFDTNGRAIFYEDRKGEPHNTLPGLISPIPIVWLKTLEDGSELKITIRVNFDKVPNDATAVTFPEGTYTVKASIEPTITSVKNSKDVEIPQGGTTTDTTVKLTGRATADLQVQILVNGTVKDTVTIDSTGEWSYTLTGLTVAAHSITAKATYGSLPESPARTFSVVQKIQIPTTHMTLDGIKLIQDFGWTEKEPPGTTETRQASAGPPPYRYTSQYPAVATVGATDGKVSARGNGVTTITVTDANGDSLSFTVSATRVCRLIRSPTPLSGPAAVSWNYTIPASGGIGYIPYQFPSQFQDLTQIYAPLGPAGSIYSGFYPSNVTPPYGGLHETWATSATTTTFSLIAAPAHSRFAYTVQLLDGHSPDRNPGTDHDVD